MFLLPILFLFLGVNAVELESTSTLIKSNIAEQINTIRGQFHNPTSSWYLAYSTLDDGANRQYHYLGKLNNDFTIDDGFDEMIVKDGGVSCLPDYDRHCMDLNPFVVPKSYPNDAIDMTLVYQISGDGTNCRVNTMEVNYTDLGMLAVQKGAEIGSTSPCANIREVSIEKSTSNAKRISRIGNSITMSDGDEWDNVNTVSISGSATNVRSILVERDTITSNHLVFYHSDESGTSDYYVEYHDTNLNYLDRDTLFTNIAINDTSIVGVEQVGGMTYYLGYRNTSDPDHIYYISKFIVDNITISLIETDTFNVSSDIGGLEIGSAYFLGYKPEDPANTINLFYTVYNTSSDKSELRVRSPTCLTSVWVNDTCVDNTMKQIRNVYPSGCDDIVRFVPSVVCELDYNRSIGIFDQEFKTYSDSSVCDTGFVETLKYPIIRCDNHLDIPNGCVNVTVNANLKLSVDYVDVWLKSNQNNFTSTVCNPLNDCDVDSSYYCQDAKDGNITWNKEQTTYVGGDSVENAFIIDGTNCGVGQAWSFSFGANEGWYRHRVIGTSNYECVLACGGTKCITEGLIEYSAQEFIDCSVNESSKVECPLGCNDLTGLCRSSTSEGAEGTPSAFTPIGILYRMFNPDGNMKLMYGLVGSSVLGLVIIAILSSLNVRNSMLGFVIGFGSGFILFSLMGWIPIVFSIVIVFMVGIFALFKFIK